MTAAPWCDTTGRIEPVPFVVLTWMAFAAKQAGWMVESGYNEGTGVIIGDRVFMPLITLASAAWLASPGWLLAQAMALAPWPFCAVMVDALGIPYVPNRQEWLDGFRYERRHWIGTFLGTMILCALPLDTPGPGACTWLLTRDCTRRTPDLIIVGLTTCRRHP